MKNRSLTIGQQIAAGLVVPLLTLMLLSFASYRYTAALLETNRLVKHTYQTIAALERLFADIQDAETGQRGFIITGDPAFLEPYERSVRQLDADHESLRALVADHPVQAARLGRLYPVMQEKLDDLRVTVEQRRRDGVEAATRSVQSGRGKRAMDTIRALSEEIRGAELDLLRQREADAERTERNMFLTLVGGSTSTALLVIVIGFAVVRGIRRRIESAVRQMQSSSAELQAAATQQAQGAKEQATASSEVSTTMKELLSTSQQIAESTQRVTQIAADTTSAARAGDDTVRRTREALDAVQRQVEQIVVHMLDFGKQSQEIGGILQIINELAEQTNILAINATIEAAGAGEAGRRFGVVADEIRKLADRVGGSTKEIRGLIEEIRGAANTTVIATESGSKAVDAGARQFSEVATSFMHIADLVKSTAEASREIELSTKQQATAVEQVNTALLEVARTARETEVSSTMTLKTSSELATLSRQLVGLIQHAGRT
jgi:methyl-accepting chemotaxis protein